MSEQAAVLYQVNDNVAVIKLNRPLSLNAVNGEICRGIKDNIAKAQLDEAVMVIVLCGEGKAFCAGGDLQTIEQLCQQSGEVIHANLTEDFSTIEAIHFCTKPTIAVVHGTVVGGGLGIASACDFVYSDERAKFMFPFIDLGIIPDMGAMYLLLQKIGLAHSRRLLMLGEPLTASQALDIQLVDKVCDPGTAREQAMITAQKLAKRYNKAMSFTKLHLNQLQCLSFEQSMKHEVNQQSLLWTTREVRDKTQTMLAALTNKKTKP